MFHTLTEAARRSADFQSAVSRVFNPLGLGPVRTRCRLEVGDTAGWKPALRILGPRPREQVCERAGLGPQSGFTLAEVLAALLFMAIVIPVAVGGLRVASLAGEVAARKSEAVRVAERLLNESIVTTNWNKSLQNGTVVEGNRQFAWTLRTDTWSQDGTQYAPRLLSVEVAYSAQDRDFVVRLHTLAPSLQPQ